ncbi:hypothetical protein SAMN06295885_1939 [Rathayibacter oskolensis]|uniref:Uncharacterized protein n=1 Tax=Rathayibacter oskolensis TaxID=1891671 RepID=A0A1X7NXM9_9MICO|nr:DUF1801 domain-containing protein [Rathayibacter oskolensis]SMH42260.1 hypothetical protein SAMN06295885_1939 [Rathayibacter oskolensis]
MTAIDDYIAAQPEAMRPVCTALAAVLDGSLERAEGTLWHGHPVWMIGKTPVAGFKAASKAVTVMLWRGQDIDAPGLAPAGSFRMANAKIATVDQVDAEQLGAWLREAEALEQ